MDHNDLPTDDQALPPEERRLLRQLEERLGYAFQTPGWLHQALVHSSYAYESPQAGASNERLEFLGDAVLSLVISDLLLAAFPEASEGDLSHRRAALVNARQLAALARDLDLGDHLRLGRGEERQGGRRKPSVLADALEAVLAAIYLDGGLEAARAVIAALFAPRLQRTKPRRSLGDYKTLLQEYTMRKFTLIPTYHLVSEIGPPHDRSFEVEVRLDEQPLAHGRGPSKKKAAQEAARDALEYLENFDG